MGAIIAPPWTARTEQTASIQNTRQIKPARATGRARLLFTPPSPAPGAQLSTPVCDIGFVNVGIINFGLPTILIRPPHRIDNASGGAVVDLPPFSGQSDEGVFAEGVRTDRKPRANMWYFRGETGVRRGAVDGGIPFHDCSGNWDHLNLIFPVYLKLMTGFPFTHPEEVGAELLH